MNTRRRTHRHAANSSARASRTSNTRRLYSSSVLVSLSSLLERRPLLLLDGAMGTELARRGFDLRDPLWSAKILLEAPDAVTAVHLDYLAAGAELICTASYQVSEEGFEQKGLTRQDARRALHLAYTLAETAVRQHSERAPDTDRGIAVSLGPYGAILADGSEYTGAYAISHAQLVRFHRGRLAVVADTGASLVAMETLPTLEEAEAVLEALEALPELKVWLSFVPGTPSSAITTLRGRNIAAVSLNCGPSELVLREAGFTARSSPYPVLAYPNRGGTWDAEAKLWRDAQEASVLDWVDAARGSGLSGLGGCCGVSPAEIARMRQRLDADPI